MTSEPQPYSRRALHRWAANFVSSVTDRSRTLASRVVHTESNEQSQLIHDPSIKDNATAGLEKWTQKNFGVGHFSSSVYEGLDFPVWRERPRIWTTMSFWSRGLIKFPKPPRRGMGQQEVGRLWGARQAVWPRLAVPC